MNKGGRAAAAWVVRMLGADEREAGRGGMSAAPSSDGRSMSWRRFLRPRGRAKRGTSALDAERKSEIVSRLYDLVSRRAADTQLTVDPERGRELPVEGVTHRGIGARLFISETTVPFTSKS